LRLPELSKFMNPADIKIALERRGVHLNQGIKVSKIVQKSKSNNITIDPYIIQIFSQFNGFQEGSSDPGSCVRLWPLEDVLAEHEGQKRSPFGDFLLDSNRFTCELENVNEPIFLDSDKVAESLVDFFVKLLSGRFDF
jgi:hypothetical protein